MPGIGWLMRYLISSCGNNTVQGKRPSANDILYK
jgi:hypothetical protein